VPPPHPVAIAQTRLRDTTTQANGARTDRESPTEMRRNCGPRVAALRTAPHDLRPTPNREITSGGHSEFWFTKSASQCAKCLSE
jgi:hypothetical protein